MEVDELVAQCFMRDRLAEAEKRAVLGALHRQSSYGSPNGNGVWRRLIELGSSLVKKSPRGTTVLRASRSTR